MTDRRQKPLPCPFCGNGDIEVGPESACARSVRCRAWRGEEMLGCGARIIKHYDGWPKGIPRTLHSLDMYLERRAIEAWNRRVDEEVR